MSTMREEVLIDIKKMEKDFYEQKEISIAWQDSFVHNLYEESIDFNKIENYVEDPMGLFVKEFKKLILGIKE